MGYKFAIAHSINNKRTHNPPQTHTDFSGFVDEMQKYSQHQFSGKGATGHDLWFPCQLNNCPDEGFPRAKNILAKPTYLFGLDFDDEGNDIVKIIEVLDKMNCDYYVYTTMSYQPGISEKCRAVVHFKHLISNNEENKKIFIGMNEFLKKFNIVIDEACKNIARKFYTPATNTLYEQNVITAAVLDRGPLDNDIFVKIADKVIKIQNDERELKYIEKRKTYHTNQNKNYSSKPYFNSINDHNIADHDRVESFMATSSKGSQMASFCSHIVGYCKARFGAYVVQDDMFITALSEWSGKTSHNNFEQNIKDARQHVGG